MLKNILYFSLCFIIFSCNNKKFTKKTGYHEIRQDNGIPKYIKFYNEQGELNGCSISFYPNGNVHSYIYFNNSKKEGATMLYYENGSLNTLDTYLKGLKEGVSVHYNEEGILTRKSYYKNDFKDGEQYFFDYNTGDTIRVEYYNRGNLVKK